MFGVAIIAAAGSGSRAGVDKVWTKVQGELVLERSVRPFLECPLIDEVIIAVREGREQDAQDLFLEEEKSVYAMRGGATRSETVRRALTFIERQRGRKDVLVAIHDGARPYVTEELVTRCMMRAAKDGSAVPVVPCADSVRRIVKGKSRAVDRNELVMVQTPQCFEFSKLLKAYEKTSEATDDATIYEAKYGSVSIVEGDVSNKKITYSSDLYEEKENRVGIGYDVHELVEGRPLILGGVTIPHTKGLLGHSDADVLTHAVMDALLTAANLPDIGQMFPPDDPEYEDANSLELLEEVYDSLCKEGFYVVNVSATIMAEKPKLAPYLEQMQSNIAKILKIKPTQVRFAATTTETLGVIGEEKGMAAEAVALLAKKEI